jgi:Domain of unknown function (DUF1707)/Cell wall-active antibiotics response 4TMS YvqF
VTGEPALRASDADRERTVALLRGHSVEGRLTLEEFAQRIDAAYAARTLEKLEQLARDLPAEAPAVPAPRRSPTRWIVAILSGTNRAGRLRLPGETKIVAVMGGVDLDLREAELDQPEVTITVVTVMGGVDIAVPEGVDVELTGLAVMGGKDYRPGRSAPPPGAPLVRIRAFALMGGVSIRTKPPRG